MHHWRALSRGPGPLSVTNLHADTLGGLFPAIHSALNRKQISLCKTHRTISWQNINTELVMGGPPKKLNRGDSQKPLGFSGFRKQPFLYKQQSLASGRTEREAEQDYSTNPVVGSRMSGNAHVQFCEKGSKRKWLLALTLAFYGSCFCFICRILLLDR